jgi:antitoxin ParD1/3/4
MTATAIASVAATTTTGNSDNQPSRRISREGWQFLPFDAIVRQRRIPMATMNISVPDLMRDYVQRRIDSGRYASVSDYVRDLIRKDQGALLERDLSVEDIRESIAQSRVEGGTAPAEQVFERIEAKLKAMADQA